MHQFIEGIAKKFKQFKPTSWAVNNRTAVYIITILISAYGLTKFNTLPREQFPDIVVPTISVSTVYFGTSPKDMENLVTRPIEKQLKGIQWRESEEDPEYLAAGFLADYCGVRHRCKNRDRKTRK